MIRLSLVCIAHLAADRARWCNGLLKAYTQRRATGIGPSVEPEQHQESDADKPTTSLSGLLRSQIPRLARFLRRRCGTALRANESVSDIRQSVCREFVERWKRSPSPDRDEGRKWMFQLARR